MKCDEFISQVEELTVDGPDVALTDELHQHQLDCDECRRQWEVMQSAWMILPASLGTVSVPDEFEDAVMRRLEAAPKVPLVVESPSFALWKYVLAASVLFILVGSSLWGPAWLSGRPSVADGDLQKVKDLARQMEKLDELEVTFASPELRYVSLRSKGQDQTQGYLIYDFIGKECHFFGYNLAPRPGRVCILWLLNADQKVVASHLVDVRDDNLGSAIISLPDDASTIDEAVVTYESGESVQTPSSDVRMRARVTSDE